MQPNGVESKDYVYDNDCWQIWVIGLPISCDWKDTVKEVCFSMVRNAHRAASRREMENQHVITTFGFYITYCVTGNTPLNKLVLS